MKKKLHYDTPNVQIQTFSEEDVIRTSGVGTLSWGSDSGEGWGDFTQNRDSTFVGGTV